MDETRLVSVEVAPEKTIQVEARAPADPEADVAWGGTFPFASLTESIEAVTTQLTAALESAKPNRAAVEFGLDVGVESGGLTALLVKGTGSATLTITLEWNRVGGNPSADGQ
jgi:hypothetical protein